MGSNDPFENLLFIQKREYHAVKDENRTDTARCHNQFPKTKKQKNSPHRPHLAGRNREFSFDSILFFHTHNIRAQVPQLFHEVFVAAIHMVDLGDLRRAFCDETR